MSSNLETTKKAYKLFKRGDISTLIKEIVDENLPGNPLGVRRYITGR